ncbi:MAG: hypothetical protein FWH16_05065 [Oscillospiraceae bacterium]|nr:hypothetical protein [Oscillospiraceae bacterium]
MIKKRAVLIISAVLLLAVSCQSFSRVAAGNYYLDGNIGNAYIKIIDDNTMRFVNFDIDLLSDYLITEGTDYRGRDAEDFRERHNLPEVFNGEIEYEFNRADNTLYIKALSNSNEPDGGYMTVNYRMKYADKNTISFMESIYSRK